MKKGFIFVETIIVVCVLTISLISIYGNYSKIISTTKELNTFDTTEYNYKTYFLKGKYLDDSGISTNACTSNIDSIFSDNGKVTICKLEGIYNSSNYLEDYNTNKKLDSYIIDYLNTKDWTEHNDNIFLVEYKKEDKQNSGEYITYISSLNY